SICSLNLDVVRKFFSKRNRRNRGNLSTFKKAETQRDALAHTYCTFQLDNWQLTIAFVSANPPTPYPARHSTASFDSATRGRMRRECRGRTRQREMHRGVVRRTIGRAARQSTPHHSPVLCSSCSSPCGGE